MKAVLVASGEPHPADTRWLADADLVVAVDGGAAWLASIGRRPDALVGDLDSVDPALVASLEAAGVPIERHPTEKDASDAELAVGRAIAAGAKTITILGALGGQRLDHELANVLLLVDPVLADRAELRLVRAGTLVRAVRGGGRLAIEAPIGALVTLLPLGGDAAGTTTSGLRYALTGETLRMGASRGLSNVVERASASVSLDRGTLLVIETWTEGVET
jgi:thiamine pyrophosphokinase